ncbi:MAG: hypothetical protein HDT43_09415 [Ruminococcaceae bacterium]|nr:hypothetical protein [Oscillospiraceae bacterium]
MTDWSTLHSPYTPPAQVFGAVCAELGAYYTERGAKYTKSNKRIIFAFERVRCEIGLRSSHSNMAGEWVNLEIIPSVFAIDTSGMERKGILITNERPVNINVVKIDDKQFAEIVSVIDGLVDKARSYETREGAASLCDDSNNAVYFARYFGNIR